MLMLPRECPAFLSAVVRIRNDGVLIWSKTAACLASGPLGSAAPRLRCPSPRALRSSYWYIRFLSATPHNIDDCNKLVTRATCSGNMVQTRDGFIWDKTGQRQGLETQAVVDSSANVKDEYDVIVVGAGWAGLIAARDISQQTNLSVLLVEARDRIGGRTYTANERGKEFEMGGNWVSRLVDI